MPCRAVIFHNIIYFREHYGDVVFVYISDDLQWGKSRLEKKANTRNMEIYFAGDNFDSVLKDRNRDRYSLVNHVIRAICTKEILLRKSIYNMFMITSFQHWT